MAQASTLISEPFAGVRYTQRIQSLPRPLRIHLLEIDLTHPGIRFLISPSNGTAPGEVSPQTVRSYVTSVSAQIGINSSFFLTSTAGANYDNRGIVASRGDVYSPFDGDARPWPVLNISADNFAQILSQAVQPSTTTAVNPPVPLYNAVSGSERIVTNGRNTAGAVTFGEPTTLQPRTVAGITSDRRLLLLAVDGRATGTSEGMFSSEVADLLIQYGVVDAVNLDGGGSTTMVFSDPTPRVLNTPSDGFERAVGASLAVFAAAAVAPRDVAVYADFYAGDRGGFVAVPGSTAGSSQGLLATSTNTTVSSQQSVQRGWHQRLTLRDDPAVSTVPENPAGGWFVRHAWTGAAAGNNPRPTRGAIGFWARTTTAGIMTTIAINAPDTADRGIKRALNPDGLWHLYEWNLGNAGDWQPWSGSDGRIDSNTFTLDSIQFFGPNADAVVDLDLVAHNALGALAAELTPPELGRLANGAVRSSITAADPTLAIGLTIGAGGTGAKPMLLRVAGPSLVAFGVTGALADPRFAVFDLSGATVASNDNWGDAGVPSATVARSGAFPFASATSLDDACVTALDAGRYIINVGGPSGGAGVIVAEAYDLSTTFTASTPRWQNFSARGRTGSGVETLIAGFVVTDGTKRVLIRAVGPGLAPFGITGALADPQLIVYAGAGLHAQNDDWGGGPVLTDAMVRAGAFPLTATSRDAALLLTLAPGPYSVHVRGANNTTGVALLEIYELP